MIHILTVAIVVPLVVGLNTLFWTAVGIGRVAATYLRRFTMRRQSDAADETEGDNRHRFRPEDVAVLIPAHNEAAVLENSLRAASALLPVSNIHVVSDGSTDHTANVAREFGANVVELSPNRGKAGALLEAIRHFDLIRDFKVVLFLDADTRPAPNFLETGLPQFDDPNVVVVAGYVKSLFDPPPPTWMGRLLVAYRARLNAVVQLLIRYGLAARWVNAVSIVPGCSSMYRTDVLAAIDITAPGLVIEDINMTFEVHAKKLGRIAFRPDAAVAYTQDPDNMRDYVSQIRRWSLGFWQTVRLHGFHTGRFWMALAVQIAEVISSSIFLVLMLPLILFLVYNDTLADTYGHPRVMGREVFGTLGPQYVLICFLVPDFMLTAVAAIALRRPKLLLLTPFFPVARLLDAYICLRTVPAAWRTDSSGRWVSPARRGARSPSWSDVGSKPGHQPLGSETSPTHRQPAKARHRATMRNSMTPDVIPHGAGSKVNAQSLTSVSSSNIEKEYALSSHRPSPQHSGPWTRAELEDMCACPYCDARVTIIELAPSVFGGTVEHNDTCRWCIAYERDVKCHY